MDWNCKYFWEHKIYVSIKKGNENTKHVHVCGSLSKSEQFVFKRVVESFFLSSSLPSSVCLQHNSPSPVFCLLLPFSLSLPPLSLSLLLSTFISFSFSLSFSLPLFPSLLLSLCLPLSLSLSFSWPLSLSIFISPFVFLSLSLSPSLPLFVFLLLPLYFPLSPLSFSISLPLSLQLPIYLSPSIIQHVSFILFIFCVFSIFYYKIKKYISIIKNN